MTTTSKILAQNALKIALTQLGVEEVPKGSNAGPQVNAYLKSVGLGGGYSWCMAFVYWCVDNAAKELNTTNPLVKTAGVLYQWNKTSLPKLPNKADGVKPGDIFIMDFGGGNGHTGFVMNVANGYVNTIEGNTNNTGSRDGYQVCKRTRSFSSIKGFIQL